MIKAMLSLMVIYGAALIVCWILGKQIGKHLKISEIKRQNFMVYMATILCFVAAYQIARGYYILDVAGLLG